MDWTHGGRIHAERDGLHREDIQQLRATAGLVIQHGLEGDAMLVSRTWACAMDSTARTRHRWA